MATALADRPGLKTADGMAKSVAAKGYVPVSALAFADEDKRWLKEFGITTANPKEFQKAWAPDEERYRRMSWHESRGGRVAIRSISRGVFGAGGYALGQIIESKSFKDYNPDKSWRNTTNLLQFVAKTIDSSLGRVISGSVFQVSKHLLGKSEREAEKNALRSITFRETRQYLGYKDYYAKHYANDNLKFVGGRSLGHEAIGITFDFGMSSLGDYTGREIANLLDPNVEKKWLKDGHIDIIGAFKAFAGHVWTAFSRAMGEDYAAMLMGYPYIVRLSRYVLDRHSPGFRFDSDYALNGGSFKVDDKCKIVGNYQIEGMADLGFRFTVYNIFTKMYRDFYDWVGSKIGKWWRNEPLSDLSEAQKAERKQSGAGILQKLADGVRYVVRTAVKMTLIMVPSTFFFYVTRAAQSKDVGLAIHPEHGPIGGMMMQPSPGNEADGLFHSVHATGAVKGKRSGVNEMDPARYPIFWDGTPAQDIFQAKRNGTYSRRFDQYGQKTGAWHDGITNFIGLRCYEASQVLTELLKPVARIFNKDMEPGKVADFSRKMAYASLAYTPYFAVKSDVLTEAWDTPRVDMGLNRTIYGLSHLKFGEFKTGIKEVILSMQGRPFSDIGRERIAQEKMRTHRDQLWGEGTDKTQAQAEREIRNQTRAAFATEKLKKPLTRLVPRPANENFAVANENIRKPGHWQQAVRPGEDIAVQRQAL